jgi:hypothetical protein
MIIASPFLSSMACTTPIAAIAVQGDLPPISDVCFAHRLDVKHKHDALQLTNDCAQDTANLEPASTAADSTEQR